MYYNFEQKVIESDLLLQFLTKIGLNKDQYNYYLSFAINFYKFWLGACSKVFLKTVNVSHLVTKF